MAELVDALVLGTSEETRGGSSPSARTSAAADDHEILCKVQICWKINASNADERRRLEARLHHRC